MEDFSGYPDNFTQAAKEADKKITCKFSGTNIKPFIKLKYNKKLCSLTPV